MALFIGCLLAHLVLVGVVSSPWWVPDLTLVGLMLATVKTPHRWLAYSGIAGLVTLSWVVRDRWPLLLSYLALGGFLRVVRRHWDVTDVRVQCVVSGLAASVLTGGAMWLEDLWSIPLLGLATVHVVMTVLAVLPARFLFGRLMPREAEPM